MRYHNGVDQIPVKTPVIKYVSNARADRIISVIPTMFPNNFARKSAVLDIVIEKNQVAVLEFLSQYWCYWISGYII